MAMKKDFKAEVLALAESMVGIPEGAFKVLHSKQECYCFDTGKKDEEGRTVYALVYVKIPDIEGTKTRDGFDVEVAKAAYEEKMTAAANKPAKKSAPKGGDPAVAEKREERMKVLRRWWENEAEYGHDYTSTEVFNALPDIYGIDVNTQGAMLTGRDLAQLAKEGLAEMNMVEKKKCYSKR